MTLIRWPRILMSFFAVLILTGGMAARAEETLIPNTTLELRVEGSIPVELGSAAWWSKKKFKPSIIKSNSSGNYPNSVRIPITYTFKEGVEQIDLEVFGVHLVLEMSTSAKKAALDQEKKYSKNPNAWYLADSYYVDNGSKFILMNLDLLEKNKHISFVTLDSTWNDDFQALNEKIKGQQYSQLQAPAPAVLIADPHSKQVVRILLSSHNQNAQVATYQLGSFENDSTFCRELDYFISQARRETIKK